LFYEGLDEEILEQQSPGSTGWGLMQQANPLLIGKRRLLKSPLERIWIDVTEDDIRYVTLLYD